MDFQLIFGWKSLPEAGFGNNVVIDADRCSGSRIHLDHPNVGRPVVQAHSSDHRFKRLHLTRASVCRASGFVLTDYSEVTLPTAILESCYIAEACHYARQAEPESDLDTVASHDASNTEVTSLVRQIGDRECKRPLVLKNSVRRRVFPRGSFFRFVFFFLVVIAYALAIAGCALMLRNRTSRFRFCATAAR
jgi:hypothetical protein